MRRLTAIFPFPRRLRGWLHLEGIPGTELEPPVEPGEPTDPGEPDICDIEILSIEPLYLPTSLAIESVDILFIDDINGIRYEATVNPNYPDGLQYRVLKNGVEYHGWQESNVFEFPFSERDNEFEFVVINFWEEVRQKVGMLPSSFEVQSEYTGELKEFVLPISGNYEIELWGAEGGGQIAGHGGKGGYVKGERHFNAGDVLAVYVGGKGKSSEGQSQLAGIPGGWNGGGNGGATLTSNAFPGCSGGGATDIRLNGNELINRIAVAAGGGGGSGNGSTVRNRDGNGGGGGGYYGGGAGNQASDGSGATQSDGGVLGGQLGLGGDAPMRNTTSTLGTNTLNPGGDGGGLFGGNGGTARANAGGGGSSYIDELIDGETESGIREGDGLAKITFLGFETASYDGHDVAFNENDDFVFSIQYSGLEAEIRILEGVNVLYDWSTDTEFVIDKSLEDQEITIEIRDALGNIVTETVIVGLSVYEEFEATHADGGPVGDIQTFTAPGTGNYRITAFGAAGEPGGEWNYGKGAKISGVFSLTAGDQLEILVGQTPLAGQLAAGGASFVTKAGIYNSGAGADSDIYVIAGGGGGYIRGTITLDEYEGRIQTSGGTSQGLARVDNGQGGILVSGDNVGAGAGFLTDGAGTGGGKSYINGAEGGNGDNGTYRGGFGGGGARNGSWGTGSGGGYSGGNGGSGGSESNCWGAGGGSYNAGTDQDNVAGIREGNGKVIIELI